MGIWDSILKYGGKAAKATGRSMGHAALHPSQTLRGTGQAVKTAAIGGAVGYVGWENAGIFDKCGAAIIPCDFKIFNKEEAQIFIDKLQSIVDQMEG